MTYQTTKARGIFRLILKIWTWRTKRKLRNQGEAHDKTWLIYNPRWKRIESLEPQIIPVDGCLYKHEINGHGEQLKRLGLVRFILAIVVNLLICGYENSPMEAEARLKEKM